jgi:uncharacterized protein YgiM (DUF1202 family)
MKKFVLFRKVWVLALVSLIAWANVGIAAAEDSTWEAKYWNNITLSGDPVLVRQENQLDHDWGQGAPNSVNPDGFSARFRRWVNFQAGEYRFTATMDDGLRFWIDDMLVIDSWTNSSVHSMSADVYLTGGDHRLKVEYYDVASSAVVKLSWVTLSIDTNPVVNDWRAEYFNNTTLAGTPAVVRNETAVNFDWGVGSPGAGIAADQFSARYTRNLNLQAGRYRFTAIADDGVRLWVNGRLLIDKWLDEAATVYNAEIDLAGGAIPVTLEYYEGAGGASLNLSWLRVSGTGTITAWRGEYFNNTTLNGTPALVRDDANIAFNWGNGSPAQGINSDNFSVRWTRTLQNVTAGKYRFTANADDGVRVWVNGALVIDKWSDHTPQDFVSDVDFAGGNMEIVMEYYENSGGARANLTRTLISNTPAPAPAPVPTGVTATVASLRLNVRQGPGVTYNVTTVLEQGRVVTVIARNQLTTWVQISLADGTKGWVYAPLLATTANLASLPLGDGTAVNPPATNTATAVVSNAVYALNVRSGPVVANNVLTSIVRGTTVTLLARNSSSTWFKVQLPNGIIGWSSASYLTTSYNISSLPVSTN